MSRLTRMRTLAALGPANLVRVGLYRLGLRSGRHPVQKLREFPVQGPFFDLSAPAPERPGAAARQDWAPGRGRAFGRDTALGARPDWHAAPLTGGRADATRPWWQIPDFDPAVGDIKTVWEPSRLDWILALAQRAALGDAEDAGARLEAWLADWACENSPYFGANWKCGQEASIRVMHLAAAAVILGQDGSPPGKGLGDLLRIHLRRIAPTMGYAIGQANNHGTSEAVALFVGGSWLGGAEGRGWARTGRRWLEDRARVLIAPDGSFSQYSVTYHRLMLDSYALAEVWRRCRNLPAFSTRLGARLSAATDWLEQMTDPATGDAPNLGANDGAQILALSGCAYRDFRPSVQLASALFRGDRTYDAGPWDQQALWLDVDLPAPRAPAPASRSLDDGGLHVLRRGRAVAYLRYPRFRFRPAQADALHLDLWVDGVNLLPDAGTYSYNVSAEDTAYFNGTRAHNTVEFDGRDQMPRLGRFLFGDWLRARDVLRVDPPGAGPAATGPLVAAAGYRDHLGASHHRRISLGAGLLRVEDRVAGFGERAVLRWRLAPGDWTLTDDGVQGRAEGAAPGTLPVRLSVAACVPIRRMTLTRGFRSLYYLEKSPLPVLEVELGQGGKVTTDIHF